MSAESVPYKSQRYEAAPITGQRHLTIVEANSETIVVEDAHTQDEAMRGTQLDRTTQAEAKHRHAVEDARKALDKLFSECDFTD